MLRKIWMCFRGPRLYRIYPDDNKDLVLIQSYNANRLERYGDFTMISINILKEILKYGSPMLLSYFYYRGMFCMDGGLYISKYILLLSVSYALAWCLRGLGRVFNPSYRIFLEDIFPEEHKQRNDVSLKRKLLKYDFEFHAWPVEYTAPPCPLQSVKSDQEPTTLSRILIRPFSWLLAHTVGLSLVYPGSTALLQAGLHPVLMQGRDSLIRQHGGIRYKLRTSDGNTVDTMYIHRSDAKGKTLVINCEGNGGYYEIGVMSSSIENGNCSVLGWNHPGFCWSTGKPFPDQERKAADAVIQFAITELGYQPSDIILYGWSIGGFTASWLACQYPDIKGVILDATFDRLLPLAVSQMYQSLSPLINDAVKTYIDLNVAEQLNQYQGKVKLIRRSKDEMITTDKNNYSTNRGNNLLEKLLTWRYPSAINQELLWTYMRLRPEEIEKFLARFNIDESKIEGILSSYENESFPLALGKDGSSHELDEDTRNQLTLVLAQKYMLDFDSSHCTPVPPSYLNCINDETN